MCASSRLLRLLQPALMRYRKLAEDGRCYLSFRHYRLRLLNACSG
jgi:hypothetical protein